MINSGDCRTKSPRSYESRVHKVLGRRLASGGSAPPHEGGGLASVAPSPHSSPRVLSPPDRRPQADGGALPPEFFAAVRIGEDPGQRACSVRVCLQLLRAAACDGFLYAMRSFLFFCQHCRVAHILVLQKARCTRRTVTKRT